VNDSLGHDKGDQLLQNVAQRLLDVVRKGDVVCRLGGDEFAVIVHDLEAETTIGLLAQRIMESMRVSMKLANTEQFVSCSIGIATYPRCAQTAEDMLKSADLAMYKVKQEGRNGFHFFTEALQEEVLYRISMESELRSGRLQSQLVQYYQPVINAQTLQICGAELLLRWNHPTRGILSPAEFIDVIEQLGYMAEVDHINIRVACKQLAQWRVSGVVDNDFSLAVNASEQLLRQSNLPEAIKAALDLSGLSGDSLSIEVTEGALVSDFDKTSLILNEIRALGLMVAIDDFGTGYSSMAYLRRLPASTLKVDRSFVQGVPGSEADSRVLKALIVMAKSLDLEVVVEGVETIEQAQLSQGYGADLFQGFLFSKPLPPDQFADFVSGHNPIAK